MPAGPAPTTATRRGRSVDAAGSTPSSLTEGILTRGRRCAPGSDAGDVAVEPAADELSHGDPAAVGQRRLAAVRRRAGLGAGAGQPAVEAVEVAVPGDRADDLLPLGRDGVEADRAAAREDVGRHALQRGAVAGLP